MNAADSHLEEAQKVLDDWGSKLKPELGQFYWLGTYESYVVLKELLAWAKNQTSGQ